MALKLLPPLQQHQKAYAALFTGPPKSKETMIPKTAPSKAAFVPAIDPKKSTNAVLIIATGLPNTTNNKTPTIKQDNTG